MKYFKHIDLANKYHVTLKTIYNWVDGTKLGKFSLELHQYEGRTYIADTSSNIAIMDQLAEKGKKYRNSLNHKIARPTDEFYKLYSPQQILDIISHLTIHKEIPRQYNYFDQGAVNWEKFADQMWDDDQANLLKSTAKLIQSNLDSIDELIEGYERVNIIDIGPGNALPIKGILSHLLEKKVLRRYIGIDISRKMLDIAEKNISHWFDKKVPFEGYVRDITHERFDDIIAKDMLNKDADKTVNIVLLLGATPMNFQSPYDLLKVIYASMGRNDLLIYTDKPDTEAERSYFAVNADPGASALSAKYSFIFDLLNVDESLYAVEMGFDTERRERYIRVRLQVGLTIKFRFEDVERDVKLEKGDTILLWRVWHQTSLEIISNFEETGFILLQSSLTRDRQYFLTISGVEAK